MYSKWPSKKQWRQFFRVLSTKEKACFFIFLFLFLGSSLFLARSFYLNHTGVVPAQGGTYIEGLIGSPRFINPLYAPASETDRDLVELMFSGLMKYNSEGELELDLAKNYEILENGKVYEFYLKDNIYWQDSQPLTAEDVVFTVETIQNPDIKSPLRTQWLGVEVEEISGSGVRFTLENSSSVFLENCTLKIIPKHIWEDVSPKNFSLSPMNLKSPVGSGPYKLETINQNEKGEVVSIDLTRNPLYFDKEPYLSKISFRFFNSEKQLLAAYNQGQIKGFSLGSLASSPSCISPSGSEKKCSLYSFTIPRYFSVFFNLEGSKVLAEEEVRKALNYGTNKEAILNSLFSGQGIPVNSPILPKIYGFKRPTTTYQFDPQKANTMLEEAGFVLPEGEETRTKTIVKERSFSFQSNLSVGSQGTEVEELQKCLSKPPAGGSDVYPEGQITGYFGLKTKAAVTRFQEKYYEEVLAPFGLSSGTGEVRSKTREKLNEVCFEEPEERIPLEISLATVDQPELKQVAREIKDQWSDLGAEVNIEFFDINTLERDILRKREFEALLFGEVLSFIPDPFPFWHSSQIGELGLNLSNYENEEIDQLLEENRSSLKPQERKEKLENFQEILLEDAPAVFLYTPYFNYYVDQDIQGIEAKLIANTSGRFTDIEDWYIETKRAWQ